MIQYVKGFVKNLIRRRISIFSLIDNNSKIHGTAMIYRFVKIVNSNVGDYSYVAPSSTLVHAEIGKFCSIGPNVRIGLGRHLLTGISTSPIFYAKENALKKPWINSASFFNEFETVKIGHDVWIGTGAIIMGGVEIGTGAVIGAGAIVTRNIPPYSIVVGSPARVIKYRFNEHQRSELLQLEWWNLPIDLVRLKANDFALIDLDCDQFLRLIK